MMDFALGVSFQNNSFSSDEFKFGLEYNYKKMFYLRGSFTVYTDKSGSSEQLFGPSFGAGLHYPFGSVSLGLDYAYRVINESALNSTNQFFTLSLGF
jgi:predicted porin